MKNWGGGSGVPIRTIVAWGGPTNEIPEGWALCDGRTLNGITTPNLVGKFIRGANNNGGTGGKNSVSVTLTTENMPSHNHNFTGASHSHTIYGHTHTYNLSGSINDQHKHTFTNYIMSVNVNASARYDFPISNFSKDRYGNNWNHFNDGWNNSTTTTSAASGSHSHNLTINSTPNTNSASTTVSGTISTVGSGSPFTIQTMPEYYELCFIMKVSDE